MPSSAIILFCHISVHLVCVFLISVTFGICITRPTCIFTALLTGKYYNPTLDIVAPFVFVAGFVFNVYAVSIRMKQLLDVQTCEQQRIEKLL